MEKTQERRGLSQFARTVSPTRTTGRALPVHKRLLDGHSGEIAVETISKADYNQWKSARDGCGQIRMGNLG